MEINYLKEFCTLADCLSFKTAASQLSVTQPTLSKHIASMESELKTLLFTRNQKNISLTKSGKTFLKYAQQILIYYDAGLDELNSISSNQHGTLNLGFTFYAMHEMLTPIMNKMNEKYPFIQTHLSSPDPKEPLTQLLKDEIDIAETYRLPFPGSEDFSFVNVKPIRFSVGIPADHPFAVKESITIKELINEAFVFTKMYPIFNGYIHQYLESYGYHLKNEIYVNSPEIMLYAVENSGVFAFLSNVEVGYTSENIVFLPISDPDFYVMVAYAWKTERQNPCILSFAEVVRDLYPEYQTND